MKPLHDDDDHARLAVVQTRVKLVVEVVQPSLSFLLRDDLFRIVRVVYHQKLSTQPRSLTAHRGREHVAA